MRNRVKGQRVEATASQARRSIESATHECAEAGLSVAVAILEGKEAKGIRGTVMMVDGSTYQDLVNLIGPIVSHALRYVEDDRREAVAASIMAYGLQVEGQE